MTDDEIDKFVNSLRGKTPREINKEIKISIPNDLLFLSRALPKMKERNEELKKTFPEVQNLIDELRLFYKDLESDEIIKIGRELFSTSIKDAMKEGEERNFGINSFKKVKKNKLFYKEAFKELNIFYHGVYCFLTKSALRKIAEKLNTKRLLSEGDVIYELKKYKSGKYEKLFDCLIPQIKDSLSHKTYFIHPKDSKINYSDEINGKPDIILTIGEFEKLCDKILFLQLAHDIVTWEFVEDFYLDIAKTMEVVDDFTKKYGCKWKEGGDISLYDIGKKLEDKREEW